MTKEYDPTKPFNEQTIKAIRETWIPKYRSGDIIPAGKRSAYKNSPHNTDKYLIDATDGIGTKALLHWRMHRSYKRNLGAAAQDAVAMVFDDLIEQGATPCRLQDHIIMQEEDERAIYELTRGLVDLSKDHRVVVTGGETAICDTMRGFEMGITATGIVYDNEPRVSQVNAGDVLIGLRSSGIHSNGLTFARQAYGLTIDKSDEELDRALGAQLPWGRTVGEELTIPTKIYLQELSNLLDDRGGNVSGLVHITGGGWTKLHELNHNSPTVDFKVDGRAQPPHDIFKHMQEQSKQMGKPLDDKAMYKKFNCGIGFVVAVTEGYDEDALESLKLHDPKVIGSVVPGKGRIEIKSAFSDREVVYQV